MKEARAGVDGRDFQKIVSVEEEEEEGGFLAREGIVFSAGAGEGHVCARRKCCDCFEIYYVAGLHGTRGSGSRSRGNFSIRDEFSKRFVNRFIGDAKIWKSKRARKFHFCSQFWRNFVKNNNRVIYNPIGITV